MNGLTTAQSDIHRPLVVAHRGASRAFPENTLAAFRGAAALGADWVELDVRRTNDMHLVVHHDAVVTLDEADVADRLRRPLVELRRDEVPPAVPDLVDVLAVCERLGVNLEIKSSPDDPDFDPSYQVCEAVVAALAGRERSRVLVTSFDLGAIDRVHALDPTVPTGLLTIDLSDVPKVIGLAASRGHRALNPWNPFVTPEVVEAAQDAGLAVNVWTVDDPERMAALAAMGVDGIITNVPDVARSVLDGGGPPRGESGDGWGVRG